MAKHLTFAIMVDLAEGRLETPAVQAAEAHLHTCTKCQAAMAGVHKLLAAMQADELLAPPPAVVARALQAFRPTAQAEGAPQVLVRKLLALLSFDSGITPSYGLRSGPAPVRQMLFTVEEFDIDLRIDSSGGGWRVAGQLLGGSAGGEVKLSGAGGYYSAPLTELGEFLLEPLAGGLYRLTIVMPDIELALPELLIGE
jgi:anti-sigma factor RsiW